MSGQELHHTAPRCLLRLRDAAEGQRDMLGDEPCSAWLEWTDEAGRWGVSVEIPRGRHTLPPSKVLDQRGVSPLDLLRRHSSGDWGEVCVADARENERALKTGLRVLSVYEVNPCGASRRVWIITEADRSSTTILLPSEY